MENEQAVQETEQVTTPDPAVVQQQQAEENRARMSGWTPKDQFKGHPERWTDAPTWNKRSDEIMPILRATNQRLEQGLEASIARTASLEKTLQKVITANESIAQREFDRALETVRTEQRAAIEAGDGQKWEDLERKKEDLNKVRPQKITPPAPTGDEVLMRNQSEFGRRNSWWFGTEDGKDPEMTGFAILLGNQLASRGIPEAMQYPEIERQVMARFPHKFSNQRKDSAVDGGSNVQNVQTGSKKASYDALPAAAKGACDAHVRSITLKYPNRDAKQTRAEWVKIYYESEA